jgi:hypothetical protein
LKSGSILLPGSTAKTQALQTAGNYTMEKQQNRKPLIKRKVGVATKEMADTIK